MNRYEVLDKFNKALIIPLGIIGVVSALFFIINWGEWVLAILSATTFILITGIVSQFDKLTMLIHEKYVEKQQLNKAKDWWIDWAKING